MSVLVFILHQRWKPVVVCYLHVVAQSDTVAIAIGILS